YDPPGGAVGCPLDRPTQSVESKSRSVLSPGPLMVGMDLKQTRTRSRPLSRPASGRGNHWGCMVPEEPDERVE
ncbi:unnamed protein product, partial [Staurois parvus]